MRFLRTGRHHRLHSCSGALVNRPEQFALSYVDKQQSCLVLVGPIVGTLAEARAMLVPDSQYKIIRLSSIEPRKVNR